MSRKVILTLATAATIAVSALASSAADAHGFGGGGFGGGHGGGFGRMGGGGFGHFGHSSFYRPGRWGHWNHWSHWNHWRHWGYYHHRWYWPGYGVYEGSAPVAAAVSGPIAAPTPGPFLLLTGIWQKDYVRPWDGAPRAGVRRRHSDSRKATEGGALNGPHVWTPLPASLAATGGKCGGDRLGGAQRQPCRLAPGGRAAA